MTTYSKLLGTARSKSNPDKAYKITLEVREGIGWVSDADGLYINQAFIRCSCPAWNIARNKLVSANKNPFTATCKHSVGVENIQFADIYRGMMDAGLTRWRPGDTWVSEQVGNALAAMMAFENSSSYAVPVKRLMANPQPPAKPAAPRSAKPVRTATPFKPATPQPADVSETAPAQSSGASSGASRRMRALELDE